MTPAAITAARTRLLPRLQRSWYCSVANGADVATWGQAVPTTSHRMIITAWFVLHEFCEGSVDLARKFLCAVHSRFPDAEVLLGELVRAGTDVLAQEHARSVLPEFELFHALSGQGLLTWEQLCRLRPIIPYRVQNERLIDTVRTRAGKAVPANLIWHLLPT